MYNKAQLNKDRKDASKPRTLAKPKDINVSDEYVSKMGYRDDSPFKNRPFIDINTPNGSIDMSNTGIDLIANGRFLPAYSGIHQFDTTTVREIPAAMNGGEYMDLTEDEIAEYRRGGYVVEELPKAQTGATTGPTPPVAGDPDYDRKLKAYNRYLINVESIGPELALKTYKASACFADYCPPAAESTTTSGFVNGPAPDQNTDPTLEYVGTNQVVKAVNENDPYGATTTTTEHLYKKKEEPPVEEIKLAPKEITEQNLKDAFTPTEPEMVWVRQYQHPEKNMFGKPKKGQEGSWIEKQVPAGSDEANRWYASSQHSPDSIAYFNKYPMYDAAGNKVFNNTITSKYTEIPKYRQFDTEGAFPYGYGPSTTTPEELSIDVETGVRRDGGYVSKQMVHFLTGGAYEEPLDKAQKGGENKDKWGRHAIDPWYGFDAKTKKFTVKDQWGRKPGDEWYGFDPTIKKYVKGSKASENPYMPEIVSAEEKYNDGPLQSTDWVWGLPIGLPAATQAMGAVGAMSLPGMASIPGATVGNLVNSGFIANSLFNTPGNVKDWYDVSQGKKDWKDAATGTAEIGLGLLGSGTGWKSLADDAVTIPANAYNKVATGNSVLPIAWKVEKTANNIPLLKNKYNLTDDEARVLDDYIASPYAVRDQDRAILNRITKENTVDLSELGMPISRINNYFKAGDNIPTGYGQTFSFPSNRSWSWGAYDSPHFTTGQEKLRLVIPSKYSKTLNQNFHAVDYTDPRLPQALARPYERELLGNVPEGFKVIGRTKSNGYDNLIIKPAAPANTSNSRILNFMGFKPAETFEEGGSASKPANRWAVTDPRSMQVGNYFPKLQDGGNTDPGNNALELHMFYDKDVYKMQKGGTKPLLGEEVYTYADRPEAQYKKDQSGGWYIMLPSTNNQYVPINDPSGKRSGELNEKAKLYVDPKKFARTYDPMMDIQTLPSETTQQVAGNLAQQVKDTNPKSLNKFIEKGVVLPDAPKIESNTPLWYPTDDIYYSPQEIEKQSTEYNRRMAECQKGDAQCFEQAQRYYNNYVAPLLNIPDYNQIKTNANITSGKTHPNYDKYGESLDSWDAAAWLAENQGKVFYKGDVNNPMSFKEQWSPISDSWEPDVEQVKKYENYWKNLNVPLGTIVNAGYAGGTGSYGTTSYNKEKGFVPSNHSAIVVGYSADGVPYLYDNGNIVSAADPGSLINRMGVTNIVAPKEVLNNTFGSIGTGERITSDVNSKLRFDTSKVQYDTDEFKPFMNVLSSEKEMIRKALGVSDSEYNELARQSMATALAETGGGDDATIRWENGMPIPSYLTDKLGAGQSTGISQINPDILFSNNDPRLVSVLKEMGLSKDTYDPWDPRDAAMATMAMVYANKKVAEANYKKTPTNDPNMSPAMMQYYQWNNPGMLKKGEAWGEDPNVQRFMNIYNSLVPVDAEGNRIFKDGGEIGYLTDQEIADLRKQGFRVDVE